MNGEQQRLGSAEPLDAEISLPCRCDIEITFNSSRSVAMAKSVLEVDEELQPTRARRTMRIGEKDDVLLVTFCATEAKQLRVSLSNFYDSAAVVARTLLEFDEQIT
ncbi:unnamed protein product [Phaeothamnion confervicola]